MNPPSSVSERDLSIIIPCFNEGENIARLEQTLFPTIATLAQSLDLEIIAVDDGSSDDTAARLRELATRHPELIVAAHDHNQGIGAALRTGIGQSCGAWIVTTDADGTYRFAELPRLLELCTDQVDIVTASPYHPQGGVENVPGYRLVLSRGASTLYRLIVGGHIHTYTALFRAFRREVFTTVPVRFDGFLAVAQMLAEASAQGYRTAEYPTVLYVRQYGQSKAKVVRLTLAHLRFMLSLLVRRPRRTAPRVRFGESA